MSINHNCVEIYIVNLHMKENKFTFYLVKKKKVLQDHLTISSVHFE